MALDRARVDQVAQLRLHLLRLHKALVDLARVDTERIHGRLTPHEFLTMLMSDPGFEWLRPMSTAIVRLDEWLDDAEPQAGEVEAIADELRVMVTPDPDGDELQRRYQGLLQRSPEVVLAHAAFLRALGR